MFRHLVNNNASTENQIEFTLINGRARESKNRMSKTKEFCGKFVKVVQLFKTVKEEILPSTNVYMVHMYTLHIQANIRNDFSDSGNDWANQKPKLNETTSTEFPFYLFSISKWICKWCLSHSHETIMNLIETKDMSFFVTLSVIRVT